MKLPPWRITASICLSVMFAASIFLPAVKTCGPGDTAQGLVLFVLGALGASVGQPGWYANPIFLVLVLRLLSAGEVRIWETIASIGMVLLAASSLNLSRLPDDSGGKDLCSFELGYWLWLFAIVGLAVMLWVKQALARE